MIIYVVQVRPKLGSSTKILLLVSFKYKYRILSYYLIRPPTTRPFYCASIFRKLIVTWDCKLKIDAYLRRLTLPGFGLRREISAEVECLAEVCLVIKEQIQSTKNVTFPRIIFADENTEISGINREIRNRSKVAYANFSNHSNSPRRESQFWVDTIHHIEARVSIKFWITTDFSEDSLWNPLSKD